MGDWTAERARIRDEMDAVLADGVIPFWLTRSVDRAHGGYLTNFDAEGRPAGGTDKYIVTQTRMIWGFSRLVPYARPEDRDALREAARQGLRFLIDRFWDRTHGGFVWKTDADGRALDDGKPVYGQSFAIYALAEYHLALGGDEALDYARRTFDLLQKYAADTARGGYYENLEPDWRPSDGGFHGGDRKSLDIHMHLMEAFTRLFDATGAELHARKLRDVVDVILRHMVDRARGFGRNQFDLDFHPLPALDLRRTWNAERGVGQALAAPADTTSYGHNVELAWLLERAWQSLKADGDVGEARDLPRALLDHALRHGYDHERGGVYRDGVADGPALVTDKEWWQHFEAMVGFLDGAVRWNDPRYGDAFVGTWDFVRRHFLHEAGESRQLLDREGRVLIGDLGNPWKGIYHTGRALAECLDRL